MTTATATRAAEPDHPDDADGATRTSGRRWWWGALAGALAAAAALGMAELVTGIFEGTKTSVVSVGEVVVENAPSWLKDFAIETFGTNDKDALIIGTTINLVVISIVLGIASTRKLWIGVTGTVALAVVGMAAAVSRPGAGFSGIWPSVFGAVAAIAVLVTLLGPWPPWQVLADLPKLAARVGLGNGAGADAPGGPTDPGRRRVSPAPSGFDRRRFLASAAVVAGGAAAAGGVGKLLQRRFSVSGARQALKLPPPATPAAALPAGTDLGVPGIAPFVTPNSTFYRIDTALVVPQVTPSEFSLDIKGMVDNPMKLSFDDLLDRELIETDITLVCISNEVGGQLAGNARWLGVPLRSLLEEAGVQDGADQLVSRSVDGYSAGTPTSAVTDGRDAIVAVGMNGEPLPLEHGFPARLVVPGLYGYTSATKWLSELELTTFDAFDAYWVPRGYAQIAPIKTFSRIDTPRGLARIEPGMTAIGGVAWDIHDGISAVEVQIDDGPWQPAELGAVPDADTWRQWTIPWEATTGSHNLTVRATNMAGQVQTEEREAPLPSGATGWHSVVVIVS